MDIWAIWLFFLLSVDINHQVVPSTVLFPKSTTRYGPFSFQCFTCLLFSVVYCTFFFSHICSCISYRNLLSCSHHPHDASPALRTLNRERRKPKKIQEDIVFVNLQKEDEEGGLYFYGLHASLSVILRTRHTQWTAGSTLNSTRALISWYSCSLCTPPSLDVSLSFHHHDYCLPRVLLPKKRLSRESRLFTLLVSWISVWMTVWSRKGVFLSPFTHLTLVLSHVLLPLVCMKPSSSSCHWSSVCHFDLESHQREREASALNQKAVFDTIGSKNLRECIRLRLW